MRNPECAMSNKLGVALFAVNPLVIEACKNPIIKAKKKKRKKREEKDKI